MTEEQTPTPMPASSRDGSAERVERVAEADRHDEEERGRHRRAEPLDAARRAALGDPVAEHDVADEESAVQERPEQAERVARPADVDQDEDADDGERQGRELRPVRSP